MIQSSRQRRNFLIYSILFLASCTVPKTLESNGPNLDIDMLRLSVSDVPKLEELQQSYEPFRAALETVLEVPVEFVPVEDLFDAVAALKLNRVDLVWAGPSEYATIIHVRTNAVPLVGISRPETRVGIVVRADSGIESVADLKGKTIEMGRVGSTNAHLLPVKLLLDAGLDPRGDVNIVHSSDHSFKALTSEEVDAWTRGLHRYPPALEEMEASPEDYPIIAEYAPIPHDVLVVSNHLTSAQVEAIRSRLLERAREVELAIVSTEALASKFAGAKLGPVSDADYNIIREVYQAIGQDE